jgi:hypothetical protein
VTQIGNKEVTMPPSTFMKRKDGKCTLLMYPNDVSLSVERKWVVGDLFLQNYYTIFDMKEKKIGMIAPKGSSNTLMKPIAAEPVAKKPEAAAQPKQAAVQVEEIKMGKLKDCEAELYEDECEEFNKKVKEDYQTALKERDMPKEDKKA